MAILLLSYFGLFVLAAFVWPTLRLWQRQRVNALVLPRDDTVEGYIGLWFRTILIVAFALLIGLSLGLDRVATGPLPWLETSLADAVGWLLLASSLVWVVIAQAHMGASWRIGIDTASRPQLVSSGVFRVSRNPIFLGMRATLLGLVLVLPNAITLVIWVAGEILMQVQVRLEESHLLSVYGTEYQRYRSAVRRWV